MKTAFSLSSGAAESDQDQDMLLREGGKSGQWCPSSCSNNGRAFTEQHEFTFEDGNGQNRQELSNACRGSIEGQYELSENSLMQSMNDDESMALQDQSANEASHLRDSSRPGQKSKGRKTKEQMKLLISYYHLYEGSWDEKNFFELVQKTGFSKKQLNKWFWDRKKKETDALEAKKLSYPGLIFAITNIKTGQDLTPEFKKICSKPIFLIEKCPKY